MPTPGRLAKSRWNAPLLVLVLCLSALAPPVPAAEAPALAPPLAGPASLAYFEENVGQRAAPVRFFAQGHARTLFLTPGDFVLTSLAVPERARDEFPTAEQLAARTSVLRGTFLDASPAVAVAGVSPHPTRVHRLGPDPDAWLRDVPAFGAVRYEGLYPGVDLLFYPAEGGIEYDVVVAPGADPSRFAVRMTGAAGVTLRDGALEFSLPNGEVIHQSAPVAYQLLDGARAPVRSAYALDGDVLRFAVGAYDPTRPLVIDPVLSFSTYLGGSKQDVNVNHGVDAAGNVYLLADTYSTDYPATNAYDASFGGCMDLIAAKLDPVAANVTYATYLGGSGCEYARAATADPQGHLYVGGASSPFSFPVVNPLPYPTRSGGVVAKLALDGKSLVFSTSLTGSSFSVVHGLRVDDQGRLHAMGSTRSRDFPLVRPIQSTISGDEPDLFLSIFSPQGNSLEFSTLYGGSLEEYGHGVAFPGDGTVAIASSTESLDYPLVDAWRGRSGGNWDAALTVLDPAAGTVRFSTYIGGSGEDYMQDIARSAPGKVIVVGYGTSKDIPQVAPLWAPGADTYDAFAVEFDVTTRRPSWSTYLAGSQFDLLYDAAEGPGGTLHLLGATASPELIPAGSLQPAIAGGGDMLLLQVNAARTAVVGGTLIGSSGGDSDGSLEALAGGGVSVVGASTAGDFPVTRAPQRFNRGDWDLVAFQVFPGTPGRPDGPHNVQVAASDPGNYTVTWEPPLDTRGGIVTRYVVYRGDEPSGAIPLASLPARTRTFTDSPAAGKVPTYWVSAVTVGGESAPAGGTCPVALAPACQTPDAPDRDDDGLADAAEPPLGTDPDDADTDDDALTDSQEVYVYRTDPLAADTDGDGAGDGDETRYLGTDPRDADTDDDGAPDGADASPRRDGRPPSYAGPGDAFLSFDPNGAIAVLVTEVEGDEASVANVMLTGNLTVEGPDGPLAWPLYFRLDADRTHGGAWSARFALPPGIVRATREDLRLLVVDDDGNAWAYAQTFTHVLHGPEWTETFGDASAQAGWRTFMEQAPAPDAPLAASAGWTYVAQPRDAEPALRLAPTHAFPGWVTAWEDPFHPASPAQLSIIPPITWTRPSFAGYATSWTPYITDSLAKGEAGFRELGYFGGSFLFGEESSIANGRSAGDFVSGFFVIGDLRDCSKGVFSRDLEGSDAAIASVACLGLAVDLAQLTPAAPQAVSANAALATGKATMKAVRRAAPGFAVDLAEMMRLCSRDVSRCGAVLEVAEFVGTDVARATRLERVTGALGPDAFLRVAARNPGAVARLEGLAGDLSARYGDDAAEQMFREAHQGGLLGSADETLDKLSQLYQRYKDLPFAEAQAGAADLAVHASRFAGREGAPEWLEQAMRRATPDDKKESYRGVLYAAQQHAARADDGRLLAIEQKHAFTDRLGFTHDVEFDQLLTGEAPGLRRVVELKRGQATERDLAQLYRQVAGVDALDTREGLERVVEWRVGGAVTEGFADGARALEGYFGVTVRILDANGAPVQAFVPG